MSGGRIIALIIIVIALAIITISMRGIDKLNEIKSYDSIVIDNIEYPTSEVEDISFSYYGYESQEVIITLKDGTVIYTSNYTLKNK